MNRFEKYKILLELERAGEISAVTALIKVWGISASFASTKVWGISASFASTKANNWHVGTLADWVNLYRDAETALFGAVTAADFSKEDVLGFLERVPSIFYDDLANDDEVLFKELFETDFSTISSDRIIEHILLWKERIFGG